jgi:hypothetical protein
MVGRLVAGPFADRLGHCLQYDGARRVSFAEPAWQYRSAQPCAIALDWAHNPSVPLGWVRALAVDGRGSNWALAELRAGAVLPRYDRLYLSPERVDAVSGLELRSMAVTSTPATIALDPLQEIDPRAPGQLAVVKELLEKSRRWSVAAPLELRAEKRAEERAGPEVRGRPPDRRDDAVEGQLLPLMYHGAGHVIAVR